MMVHELAAASKDLNDRAISPNQDGYGDRQPEGGMDSYAQSLYQQT